MCFDAEESVAFVVLVFGGSNLFCCCPKGPLCLFFFFGPFFLVLFCVFDCFLILLIFLSVVCEFFHFT